MCAVNINRASLKYSKNNRYVMLFAQRSIIQSRLGTCRWRKRGVALPGRGAGLNYPLLRTVSHFLTHGSLRSIVGYVQVRSCCIRDKSIPIGRIYTRGELSDAEFILEDDLSITDDLASGTDTSSKQKSGV